MIWFDGDSSAQAMDNQGLLLRNWTPNDFSNYTALGKSLVAKDHSYFPTGVTAMGAIGYNPHVVSPSELPKTLNDLLKPQWKNEVAINDPAISGPAYPLIAGIVQQEGGLQAGRALPGSAEAERIACVFDEQCHHRECPVWAREAGVCAGFGAHRSKGVRQAYRHRLPAVGRVHASSVIAIDAKAPDMAAAKEFVQWVLTQQAQDIMRNPKNGGGDSYYQPVVQGVQPNPAAVRPGVHWVKVNPIVAAEEKNSLEASLP